MCTKKKNASFLEFFNFFENKRWLDEIDGAVFYKSPWIISCRCLSRYISRLKLIGYLANRLRYNWDLYPPLEKGNCWRNLDLREESRSKKYYQQPINRITGCFSKFNYFELPSKIVKSLFNWNCEVSLDWILVKADLGWFK